MIEMTYRAQLQPWLALQPTVQYIGNPSMAPALKDAWVIGHEPKLLSNFNQIPTGFTQRKTSG